MSTLTTFRPTPRPPVPWVAAHRTEANRSLHEALALAQRAGRLGEAHWTRRQLHHAAQVE